jgi:hypothetical protein
MPNVLWALKCSMTGLSNIVTKKEADGSFVMSAIRTHCWFYVLDMEGIFSLSGTPFLGRIFTYIHITSTWYNRNFFSVLHLHDVQNRFEQNLPLLMRILHSLIASSIGCRRFHLTLWLVSASCWWGELSFLDIIFFAHWYPSEAGPCIFLFFSHSLRSQD